ncbi:arylsulfatase [Cupriavidus pinatubonensis]|uniref:arylsulfatase n=1 Tax=Cupriavidus pinatubonensis TaxID=248026 RepID=UPI00112854FB|nr:arylsulfatase [Cupriavidus pinatubonensis]TPQ37850.1 arylsulfatase [Cupriavidus pinatubonensis]
MYRPPPIPARLSRLASVALLATGALLAATASAQGTQRPNVLLILADNLGYGELGVYGGGALRGAPTPRIDKLASEGMRLTNMNMEPQCTPSRSAMLTGRYAIRSGTYAVPLPGQAEGLPQWEVTMAETLSNAGYATALYGKWHLGSENGRLPNDQGFDEWYGIPRTTNEAMFPGSPGYSPELRRPEYIMEGRKGEKSHDVRVYDMDERRQMDADLTRRAVDFMERQSKAGKPFFAFASLTQPHFPTVPNKRWAGKTGNGDWADMLAEMDANVGQMLDAIDRLGQRNNTIVIFASDNGAEYLRPWDGWSGPWRGQYFTAYEGGIRVPFMIRWPGKIPAGRVSNEIVHGIDVFPTIAHATGTHVPDDRPIDGVDQTAFLEGKTDKSAREGILIWVDNRLQAAKWHNFKAHFYQQDNMEAPAAKLPIPYFFDLYTNPREDEQKRMYSSWAIGPMMKMIGDFQASTKKYPLIPMGTPDPYVPPAPKP